jgi:hypothetical protein
MSSSESKRDDLASGNTDIPTWGIDTFESCGFKVLPNMVSPIKVESLITALARPQSRPSAQLRKAGSVYGARNLLRVCPAVAELALSSDFRSLAVATLGPAAFPARALYFDKAQGANWGVAWHQDLTIAVTKRIEAPGFSAWSVKSGVTHVQPPLDILQRMVTLRVHLDNCGADNGALRVLPRSHRGGVLTPEEITRWEKTEQPFTVEVPRGGVLVMRPLLLHSSLPAVKPSHRRVIHIEYGAGPLPNGLEWFDQRLASHPPCAL